MFNTRRIIPRTLRFVRFNSTTAKDYVRKKPTFFELLKTPTTKSLLLTLLTTSISIDLINTRKNLETLKTSYSLKYEILMEIIEKLNNNEKIDLAKELRLANSFTDNQYNSRTDIEFDEQLEQFLKEISEEPKEAQSKEAQPKAVQPKDAVEVIEQQPNVESTKPEKKSNTVFY
ncbi:hypothetical protein SBY92_001265 [Candida maltosa Xu316]|uniref:Uncharacterized protein n=1 Tax=Candida maltosa (strain Xu316) TaxID=1245528 RepID=M3ISC7_CANMX|nr:hypothetical protein G210_5762 [Candida maltosa Xu316]